MPVNLSDIAVPRPEHDAHAAAADFLDDLIIAEARKRLGRGILGNDRLVSCEKNLVVSGGSAE